jgi:hypothetical protein
VLTFNYMKGKKIKRRIQIEGEMTERYKKEKIKHRKGRRERTNEESNPRIQNGNMVKRFSNNWHHFM